MATNNSHSQMVLAVSEALGNSLSADRAIRNRGEQALAMLETNEDYGLILMEISLSEEAFDFPIRHIAAVLLDGYIGKHWSEVANKFVPPVVSELVKPVLRQYLLKSLTISGPVEGGNSGQDIHGPTKLLLTSYAHSLAKIAQTDWPGNWPELFPVLCEYLASGSPSAVYSTLAVFGELAHEITDMQIPSVAPILLPQMLNIFISGGGGGHFLPRYRASAITIFVTISETILLMAEYQKDAVRVYLEPHIPRFAEAVIAVLGAPENTSSGNLQAQGPLEVDVALKADIIAGLTKLLKSGKKYLKEYLPRMMELIWNGLTTSAPVYVQRIVNSNSFDAISVVPGADFYAEPQSETGSSAASDGTSSFEAYIYAILDFVMHIFESTKYRALIKPVLADLLYYVLYYIQITDEQEETWSSDLDQFIEDDDLDSTGYSIRLSAQDLLLALSRDLCILETDSSKTGSSKKRIEDDHLFKVAFLQAVRRHFAYASELEKSSSNGNPAGKAWWKIVESCLYSLGMIAPTVIYTINNTSGDQNLANEYKAILDTVLSSMNTQLAQPFLAGRSIWTASRFSPIMNDQSLEGFLKMTASVLSLPPEQGVLRIYALRSTYYFCDNVQVNSKVHVIKPHLGTFLQGLVSIGQGANSETLYLVLQTMAILLKLDAAFTASVAGPICSLATSAFLTFPDDPTVFDVALDLYDELLKLDGEGSCYGVVAERLLPTIVSMLQVPPTSGPGESVSVLLKDATGSDSVRAIGRNCLLTLQPQAMDVLTHLVRASPLPLSEALIGGAFPALMSCLAAASKEDSAALQNGSEAVRWFVAKGAEQLSGRSYVIGAGDQEGHNGGTNGIVLALNLCNNLLSPSVPESASTYVGRLIVVLITRANAVLGHDAIQHLLRSTLVKLNGAKELPLVQSLVLVFAHLLYSDQLFTTILHFLHSLPAPEGGGRSALAFVLDRWLGVQLYFVGYENKAAVGALARLFAHSLEEGSSSGGDLNLHRIEVSCEGEGDNGAVRTRSKGKECQQKTVPATVKMLKLLLNEYTHILEVKEAAEVKFSDDEDDSQDDSDDDDEREADKKLFATLDLNGGDQKIIDLTDLLLEDEESGDGEGEEDEIISEEIAAIDLEETLRAVLRSFKGAPIAGEFVAHLTNGEREVLGRL